MRRPLQGSGRAGPAYSDLAPRRTGRLSPVSKLQNRSNSTASARTLAAYWHEPRSYQKKPTNVPDADERDLTNKGRLAR